MVLRTFFEFSYPLFLFSLLIKILNKKLKINYKEKK